MSLKQQIEWREPYVSRGLNQKLCGILPFGIYRGFDVVPGGGMTLNIVPESGYPLSVGVVDRNGYNFTITGDSLETYTIANGTSGVWFLCIDAEYIVSGGGYNTFVFVQEAGIEDTMLVLCRVTIPGGTTVITAPMIDYTRRTTASLYVDGVTIGEVLALMQALAAGIVGNVYDFVNGTETDTIELPWAYDTTRNNLEVYINGVRQKYDTLTFVDSTHVQVGADIPVGADCEVICNIIGYQAFVDTSAVSLANRYFYGQI